MSLVAVPPTFSLVQFLRGENRLLLPRPRSILRARPWSPEMAPLLQAAGEVAWDDSWTTAGPQLG